MRSGTSEQCFKGLDALSDESGRQRKVVVVSEVRWFCLRRGVLEEGWKRTRRKDVEIVERGRRGGE